MGGWDTTFSVGLIGVVGSLKYGSVGPAPATDLITSYHLVASPGVCALNASSEVPESLLPSPLLTSFPLTLNFAPLVEPITASGR